MEIKLPLPSGMRHWVENLSAELQATLLQTSSDESGDATIVRLSSKIEELGSLVRLLTIQDDTAHELALADSPEDAQLVSGQRQGPSGSHNVPSSERQRSIQGYLQASKARRAAAKAFKSGKSKRRTRRRK